MLRFAEIKCFLIMARLCLVCLVLSRSCTLAMLCPGGHPRIGHTYITFIKVSNRSSVYWHELGTPLKLNYIIKSS